MIDLLLDAGLPRGAAADLRDHGWDVQHVTDLGLGAAKDEEILAAAEARQLAILGSGAISDPNLSATQHDVA